MQTAKRNPQNLRQGAVILYDYAVMAAVIVERTFPPTTVNDVERIAAALNLLNAIVKLQEGKQLTSYHYIKGMVSCLYVWLLYHPEDGVELYWNKAEDVTYIRVCGQQYSFHHVPLVKYYARLRDGEGVTPQQWDGLERQNIAVELFQKAVGVPLPTVDDEEAKTVVGKMRHCSVRKIIRRINELEGVPSIITDTPPPPAVGAGPVPARPPKPPQQQRQQQLRRMKRFRIFVERHLPSPYHPVGKYGEWRQLAARWLDTQHDYLFKLTLALKFNGWWEQEYELSRRGDTHVCHVVAYTGDNYSHLAQALMGQRPLRYIRPERLMRKGWQYLLRRSNWAWVHLTYTRYLLLVGHYNYLKMNGKYYNLCITYGLARYLAAAYPQLRFLNILNFTRFKVHRRVYSAKDLQRIGLHSKSRRLKVWMVVDPLLLLANLNVESLPEELLAEYREAADHYTIFRKVGHNGKVGLVAYERFHLLPAIYREVQIHGHYAHVMNEEGKWAIYSLMKEEFETDFIFSAIHFDPSLYVIVGYKEEEEVIIHEMVTPD